MRRYGGRMTKTLGVIASVCLASSAIAATDQGAIIGGKQTTLGQFPSVVAIGVGNGLCTGTLITPDWVLTAAHCLLPAEVGLKTQDEVTASVRVHFGTVDVRQFAGTVVGASQTIWNPKFNIDALGSSDIGLILLKTPVTSVAPLAVNLTAAGAPVGVNVTTVGFGKTATAGQGIAGVEYAVEQTSVACGPALGGSDTFLLCFSQVTGKGTCSGDSGGPSFANIGGQATQVGITSFGDDKCAQFGGITRVDAERAFLLEHVPELADSSPPAGSASGSDSPSGSGTPSTASASSGGCSAGNSPDLLIGLTFAGLLLGARRRIK
jgi:secreted trypsin-like serine protease